MMLGVLGCGGRRTGADRDDPPGRRLPGDADDDVHRGGRHAVRRADAGRPACRFPGASPSRPTAGCFVSERPGRVRVFQNGALLAEPALTLTDVFTRDESGILGLAVHPDFATNHFVYLTYTANGPRGPIARLMRFREVDNRLAEGVVLLDDVPATTSTTARA